MTLRKPFERWGSVLRSKRAAAQSNLGVQPMLKILIATDGSEHSVHATEHAIRLAREASGSEAVLLNVEPSPIDWQTHRIEQDVVVAHLRQHGAETCESARKLLDDAGIGARPLGVLGLRYPGAACDKRIRAAVVERSGQRPCPSATRSPTAAGGSCASPRKAPPIGRRFRETPPPGRA